MAFHEHATSYLIAELFERHDRKRFELFGISVTLAFRRAGLGIARAGKVGATAILHFQGICRIDAVLKCGTAHDAVPFRGASANMRSRSREPCKIERIRAQGQGAYRNNRKCRGSCQAKAESGEKFNRPVHDVNPASSA
jgi:hypothetical protein